MVDRNFSRLDDMIKKLQPKAGNTKGETTIPTMSDLAESRLSKTTNETVDSDHRGTKSQLRS